MKKIGLIVLVFLLVPLMQAASIDMHDKYDKGETIIAKFNVNFEEPLEKGHLSFYRGHVEIPLDFEIIKIEESYYLWASTVGREEANYSLKVDGIRYYEVGQVVDESFSKNFSITSDVAQFFLEPGVMFTSTDFFLEVQSLVDEEIYITVGTNPQQTIALSPGQKESIPLIVDNLEGKEEITLSSEKTSYNGVVFVFGKDLCGNGIVDDGEECDGSEWGNIGTCEDLDFVGGALSCRGNESARGCTFDTSSCLEKERECDDEKPCDEEMICINYECFAQNLTCEETGCETGFECIDKNCVEKEEDCLIGSACFEAKKKCVEKNGAVCKAPEVCVGTLDESNSEQCCLGICEAPKSSTGKIIGWILIILIGAFVAWFGVKYRKTKRGAANLTKFKK